MMLSRAPLAALPLVLLAVGCGRRDVQPPPAKPAKVVVSPAVTREVTDYEEFTGHTKATAAIEVRARVTGYLQQANFKEGAEVKKGDVLFEIDPRIYQAEVERAEANVGQAEARVKRLTSEYQRAGELRARRSLSVEEYEKIAGDKAEAEAAVKSAEAARDLARLNLDFTKVTAPLAGRVGDTRVDPGNLVKADDTILTTLVSSDPIHAYFDVDERTHLRVRRLIEAGKVQSARVVPRPVLLSLADEDDYTHVGVIDFIDNQIEATTGTLRVRAVFPNPKGVLTPGLFVRIRLPIGVPHQSVIVPERALGSDQGQKYVYVVDDKNEVNYRKIKVGALNKGYRVVEDGLKEGEKVIVSGLQRVRPRAEVDAKVEPIPAGAGSVPPPPTLPTAELAALTRINGGR